MAILEMKHKISNYFSVIRILFKISIVIFIHVNKNGQTEDGVFLIQIFNFIPSLLNLH